MSNIDLGSLNYLAIIVGIIFNQVFGAAWYTAPGASPGWPRSASRKKTWRR